MFCRFQEAPAVLAENPAPCGLFSKDTRRGHLLQTPFSFITNQTLPNRTMNRIVSAPLFAALLAAAPAFAAGVEKDKPLPAAEMKADENYILPPPEEVFNALRSVSKVDFAKLSASFAKDPNTGKSKFSSDAAKAANLGMRVADAFIAVQAKDAQALRRASDVIEVLSLELSADLSLKNKIAVANKLAEDGKWSELRTILEAVRVDVLAELKANKDKDSVALATVGGWLRGLNIASMALADNYDADATKLMRQPMLVAYLKRQLEGLGGKAKGSAFVTKMISQMDAIAKLTDIPDGKTMSKEDLQKLSQISGELVSAAGA